MSDFGTAITPGSARLIWTGMIWAAVIQHVPSPMHLAQDLVQASRMVLLGTNYLQRRAKRSAQINGIFRKKPAAWPCVDRNWAFRLEAANLGYRWVVLRFVSILCGGGYLNCISGVPIMSATRAVLSR